MQISKSPQQSWHIISSILQNYILITSTPLMFRDIFKKTYVFGNESYQTIYDQEKRIWDEYISSPANRNQQGPSHNADVYKPNYVLYSEVWENLLKAGLVDVFIHRLLGSQVDMESYRARSEKYVKVFDEILGTNDQYNDLDVITRNLLEMLKDYLCRNIVDLEEKGKDMSVAEVLYAARQAYRKRRYPDNVENGSIRKYYIPFDERTYTFGLLRQMDEIAENMDMPMNTRYFLMIAEYIHTLFVYVYMVEYIKYYPSYKGFSFKILPEKLFIGCKYNLFTYLKTVDYASAYNQEKARKAERRGNF